MTAGRSVTNDHPMPSAARGIGPVRFGFLAAAWLFVAGVVVQVFLVGLDIFGELGGAVHRDFAYVYGWLAPIMVLLSGAARVPTGTRRLTIVLLVLFAAQTVLPSLRNQVPVLAALHAVNALAIFAIGIVVARRATEWFRSEAGPAATP